MSQLAYPDPPVYFTCFETANALEPPQIPSEFTSHFRLFGEPVSFSSEQQSLSEFGIDQLYDVSCDIKSELSKLNRSFLFNFCELLKVVLSDPSQFLPKITQLETISLNMRFLLDRYRSIEGKFTLSNSLQKSTSEIEDIIKRLKNHKSTEFTNFDKEPDNP
ncbi:hypothetical protein RCL1_004479 [Eukaryota sp. TZLM3-RCL]